MFEEVKKQRMIEKSKAKEELLQSLGRRLPQRSTKKPIEKPKATTETINED
jgi:hypothetical protein